MTPRPHYFFATSSALIVVAVAAARPTFAQPAAAPATPAPESAPASTESEPGQPSLVPVGEPPPAASAQPVPSVAPTVAPEATVEPAPAAAETVPSSPAPADDKPYILSGYVEAVYSWNFNRPYSGQTAYRGFDNRHNSFTLSNVVLDAQWDKGPLLGRVALQVGNTPASYYAAEPSVPGGAGVNESNAELWRYIQQAYAGYRFGGDKGIAVSAGVFLSPIGPESMAVRDNWNQSRSNLFFGLPFYHTGVKATYAITPKLGVTAGVFNGWNSVVDNNSNKSVMAQVTYNTSAIAASLLYFGGVERGNDSVGRPPAEGTPWRHLVDAHITWNVNCRVSLLAHANAGTENTKLGTANWLAGAAYARVLITSGLYLAARLDRMSEKRLVAQTGEKLSIFFPAGRVSSSTATIDYRPHSNVSFRLELRHDSADEKIYLPQRLPETLLTSQTTVTVGATSWF